MNMRTLMTFMFVCSFCFDAWSQETSGIYERPNIVLFIVDDLGWQDCSVAMHDERTVWNDRYRTPHVERLAREGIRFTNAYASSPVCTPTRVSIMTGQNPARHGVTNWTLRANRDTSAGHPTVKPPVWNVNGIGSEHVTLAKLLQASGYRTIHCGKAHFGAKGTSGADPCALGFDVNIAGHAAGAPGSHQGMRHYSGNHTGGGNIWDVPGLEKYHGTDTYLTDALTMEVLPAIDEAVERGAPFYLNMAHYGVHTPIEADGSTVASYAALHPKEAAYASMIEACDRSLGMLIERLEALGVYDNTVIVFFSDNGGLSAHGRGGERHVHNAPLRSGKGSSFEGGVRVPMVVRWPGHGLKHDRCDVSVIAEDLFATFLSIAGVASPDGHAVDGRDLTDLVAGDESGWRGRPLVFHYPHKWGAPGPGIFPFSAIRVGDWKLIWNHATGELALYDLRSDLGETTDVALKHEQRAALMTTMLREQLQAMGAGRSVLKETGEAVAWPVFVASEGDDS